MKYEDQIELLHNDLHNIIYRYKSEYELHDETIIGALECLKLSVIESFTINLDCDIDLDDEEEDDKDKHF